MQKNTAINVPKFFLQYDRPLFWISSIVAILFFLSAIYFEKYLLFVIPFALAFCTLVLLNFRFVFYFMLVVLPVSVETYIGDYGTDLPSEPLVVLLAAAAFLFLLVPANKKHFKLFQHPIIIVFSLLFLWSLFVLLFSTDVFLSIKYILAKAWYLLCFLILPILLIKDKKSFQNFFWCLFIPTFLSVVYIMIRHGLMQFTFDSITPAVHPIYRNHVNYAVFITMLLPFIFLARTWYSKEMLRYKLLTFAIFLFLLAIYFSYTRGAWLAVFAMFFYYVVLRLNLTKYLLIVAAIVVIGFTAYILKDNNYLKFAPNYETTIYHDDLTDHLSSTFEMEDMSTVERFYRWIAAIKLFKDHPMVGVGPNNFVSNYKQYTVTAYETYISENEERSTVHNYFLLLLAEQGLPAMLLFIALIVSILITAQYVFNVADDTNKNYIVALTLCIVAFLLNNTLSDLVEANKVGSLFLMSIGLLINFSNRTISIQD